MAGTYILNLNILPASIHVQNMLVLLQVNPDNAWSCNDLFYIYISKDIHVNIYVLDAEGENT